MVSLLLAACMLACAAGAPQAPLSDTLEGSGEPPLEVAARSGLAPFAADGDTVSLLRSNFDMADDGAFQYGFETSDGTVVDTVGGPRQIGDAVGVAMSGSYQYISPEGIPVKVTWVADEGGFRAEGDQVPAEPEYVAQLRQTLPAVQQVSVRTAADDAALVDNAVQSVAASVDNTVESIAVPAVESATDLIDNAVETGAASVDAIAGSVNTITESVAVPVNSITGSVAAPINSITGSVAAPINSITGSVAAPVDNTAESIAAPAVESATTLVDSTVESAVALVDTAVQSVAAPVDKAVEAVEVTADPAAAPADPAVQIVKIASNDAPVQVIVPEVPASSEFIVLDASSEPAGEELLSAAADA